MQGQTCVICSALFQEFGHNAAPVKRGRCCNLCNDAVVIPERIRLMRLQDETVHKIQRDRERKLLGTAETRWQIDEALK